MAKPMPFDVALNGLMLVTPKLANILVWMVFVVSHISIALVILALVWWFQVSPLSIQSGWERLFLSTAGATTEKTIAFLGLSSAGLLWAYAKFWRWLLHKMLSRFLFGQEGS